MVIWISLFMIFLARMKEENEEAFPFGERHW